MALGLATGLFLASPTASYSPVLLVVPALWALAWVAGEQPLPRTPLNAALLLLSLMVLVSLYATYDLSISVGKVGGVVLGIAVFFATARAGRGPRGWWVGLLALLILGAGVAALAVFTVPWSTKLGFLAPIASRVLAVAARVPVERSVSPNEVAGALLWVLPGWAALAAFAMTRLRALRSAVGRMLATTMVTLLTGVTLAVLAVLALTQSRSAYIGLALAAPIIAVAAAPRRLRIVVAGAAVFVFVAGGLVLMGAGVNMPALLGASSAEYGDPAAPLQTLEGRVEIWSRALYGLEDFPFTGMGMNTFRHIVHVLYPLFLVSPDIDIAHAHNEFLQAGLDLGIPGLIAFVALYIVSFWMLYQTGRSRGAFTLSFRPFAVHVLAADQEHRETPDPASAPHTDALHLSMRALAFGLGAGLLAHMLYGLTDAIALGARPGVLFWMLLGLVTALHGQACPRATVRETLP